MTAIPIGPKNKNLVEDVQILLPVKFPWSPFSSYRAEVEMSQPIRGQGGHLFFLIGTKKHKLSRGCLDLDSSQVSSNSIQWFLRSKKVSANQRQGRPSYFWDQPKKHKLGRGHCGLASSKVLLNFVQRFQRSRKCLSQSEARAEILFSDPPEKHKIGRASRDLASCQDLLNSVQWFQRRSRKCLSQ